MIARIRRRLFGLRPRFMTTQASGFVGTRPLRQCEAENIPKYCDRVLHQRLCCRRCKTYPLCDKKWFSISVIGRPTFMSFASVIW